MSNELEPVRCGCRGNAAVLLGESTTYFEVKCCRCGTKTALKRTRNEAIETWNKAMGERTAKVEDIQVEWGDDEYVNDRMGAMYHYGNCGNCGKKVSHNQKYCHECGVKLEWNEE